MTAPYTKGCGGLDIGVYFLDIKEEVKFDSAYIA